MSVKQQILICDDQHIIHETLGVYLRNEGFECISAFDGEQAIEEFNRKKPNLVILDLMMPKKSGMDVCREIRQNSSVPIIMLTAKSEEIDRVLGLELGADDYITKPFSVRELTARVKANLRRNYETREEDNQRPMTFGSLTIDPSVYKVTKNGRELELTLLEFELLKFLAMQPGKIFSREALLEKVWGYDYFGEVRTVDVTVRRLREKVEDNPGAPVYIMTKRGVGYYFNK